ncbi:hypothetical protein PR048_000451 [Dryococelus australis]|uniref:Transposase Tc1-like domain-containing protein n=1 Tax=Dryococelus australis TaxID=614101 RepID=A0ABQ9IES7_9NEOP|nr:hypothetical protein PR048_000451 [Dryococelus australis]
MVVTDSTASFTTLARHWSTATGVDLSASTVRRRLLRAGLAARMPLRRLPLSKNHKRPRQQWARDRCRWRTEWRNVCLRTSPASTCLSEMAAYELGVIVVTAIWQPVSWSVIADKRQGNARPNVARNMQAFFYERREALLPWPARSPDMSPMKHVWDMVGLLLVRHGPPTTTFDALWTRIQTAREVGLLHLQPVRVRSSFGYGRAASANAINRRRIPFAVVGAPEGTRSGRALSSPPTSSEELDSRVRKAHSTQGGEEAKFLTGEFATGRRKVLRCSKRRRFSDGAPEVIKRSTCMRKAVSPHETLAATLRLLATGRSYKDLEFTTITSKQALSEIILETCKSIYKVLRKDYLNDSKNREFQSDYMNDSPPRASELALWNELVPRITKSPSILLKPQRLRTEQAGECNIPIPKGLPYLEKIATGATVTQWIDINQGGRSSSVAREPNKGATEAQGLENAIRRAQLPMEGEARSDGGGGDGSGIVQHDYRVRESGVTPPGIEPGSPRWEASSLTTKPPRRRFPNGGNATMEVISISLGDGNGAFSEQERRKTRLNGVSKPAVQFNSRRHRSSLLRKPTGPRQFSPRFPNARIRCDPAFNLPPISLVAGRRVRAKSSVYRELPLSPFKRQSAPPSKSDRSCRLSSELFSNQGEPRSTLAPHFRIRNMTDVAVCRIGFLFIFPSFRHFVSSSLHLTTRGCGG